MVEALGILLAKRVEREEYRFLVDLSTFCGEAVAYSSCLARSRCDVPFN